ncbi:MAG TPA: ABC transporter permease [Conexibacter sp.]|nr:ABC transporter permease [Conexibacter sp.]
MSALRRRGHRTGGASLNVTYLRFELLRTLRNRRFLFLSLGFPLVFYLLVAGSAHSERNLAGSGLSAPLYYMVGLVAFGTMSAMLSSGARIAAERQAGWHRQVRITPLPPRSYLSAKVMTAYLMAGLSIVVLYVAGAAMGVSLPAGRWLEMTGLILVGLIPFAAAGILIGHLLSVEAVGPAMGGGIALLAFLGGTWFPIPDHGVLHVVGQLLPSYWLVQASHVALGGAAWGTRGWVTIAVWTFVLARLARRAFERDTSRV